MEPRRVAAKEAVTALNICQKTMDCYINREEDPTSAQTMTGR